MHSRGKNQVYVLWTLCRYCSLNTFNLYKLLWPQCGYCIWGGKFHDMFYEIYANVASWIPSIHIGYCDPNMGIAFEKACFLNPMQFEYLNPYRLLWLQCGYCIWGGKIQCMFCEFHVGIAFEEKNLACVLWTLCEYCIWKENIQCVFCELYVGVAFKEKKSNDCFVNSMWVLQLYTFNLVVNKHWGCKYCIFCIGEFFFYGNILES